MEFHRRAITKTASGFIPLAEDNELFRSTSNMILTTQSHPEMKGPLAANMLNATPAYKGGMEPSELKKIEAAMMGHQDGDAVFRRIMAWVAER
jgi:hypothetical protein